MYERNINVLEMFIEKKLGYVETNNIKNNYYDYKDFVKVLGEYINIRDEESRAKQEYAQAVQNIKNIQATKEKLYNQNVKFEYSRNMLFNDVNRKIEEIEKCLVKIESALDKNKDTFKTLRQNFIQGIITLNEKHRQFKKIAKPKNKIEAEYKEALILLKENYQAINLDDIELTKKFIESAQIFEDELIEKLIRNGKDEKVPFDQNAITAAAKLGLDIAQKEAENYLFMYEQTGKILNELENDKLKLEARKKHITDTEVKLSFLDTEKEYLVQFLDNERVTAIQGQEEHSKLMKNCSNLLKEDAAQINTLYDLIIKETKKRATNRCYEELYNKAYLERIQAKEKKFIEKTNGINCANGTLISPNYWRIDSIKAIYDNFDKSVFEVYGRKFVAQEDENKDNNVEQVQTIEKVVQNVVQNIEAEANKIEQEEKPVVQKAQKQVQAQKEEQVDQPVKAPVDKQAQIQARIQVLAQARKAAQEKAKAKALAQAKAQQNTETKNAVTEEQSSINKILNAKALPKYKRTQKATIEDEIDIKETKAKKPSLAEKSMFEIAQESNNDTELDDIEAIIKQAEQAIEVKPQKSKKASLLKKIVKANKGKLAEE